MNDEEQLRRQLTAAHAEAMKVGDSPLRADRVAEQIRTATRELAAADLGEERTARIGAFLADALRVLRRDDDGREAAKHLQAALRLFDAAPPRPSPFLDDV
jgi:hypothetical protein